MANSQISPRKSSRHSIGQNLSSLKGRRFKLGKQTYQLIDTIATGPFSSVFLVSTDENVSYAMKIESQNGCIRPVLKLDHAVLSVLSGTRGFPTLFDAGRTKDFKYVVMELVGPDLTMLLDQMPRYRFTDSTIYKIAIQTLERLKVLHDAGWLNRDVKAQNFAVGLGDDSSTIYMLDFGLTRKFVDKDGKRFLLRGWGPSVGTFPYAPLNSLGFHDQTPADDLEGWLYMVVHLLKGLPWHNSHRQLNLAKVREWKMYCRRPGGRKRLFDGIPQKWSHIFDIITKTAYHERPQYDLISNLIVSIAKDEKIDLKMPFDWQVVPKLRQLVQLDSEVSLIDAQTNSLSRQTLIANN